MCIRDRPRAAVCGDQVYIITTNNMYTCSGSALIQSRKSWFKSNVWNKIAAPPVAYTTCVSIHGRLLAIGGMDSLKLKPTTAVYMYKPTTNSWEVISHMKTSRYNCFVGVFPNNQLVVAGDTDSVELATVET